MEADWISWMKSIHIPHVLDTGYFIDYRFLKLLTEVPDATGATYAIQYLAKSNDDIAMYVKLESARLQQEVMEHFSGKFVAFRTILEEI